MCIVLSCQNGTLFLILKVVLLLRRVLLWQEANTALILATTGTLSVNHDGIVKHHQLLYTSWQRLTTLLAEMTFNKA